MRVTDELANDSNLYDAVTWCEQLPCSCSLGQLGCQLALYNRGIYDLRVEIYQNKLFVCDIFYTLKSRNKNILSLIIFLPPKRWECE